MVNGHLTKRLVHLLFVVVVDGIVAERCNDTTHKGSQIMPSSPIEKAATGSLGLKEIETLTTKRRFLFDFEVSAARSPIFM
jgi:hypothetical protein